MIARSGPIPALLAFTLGAVLFSAGCSSSGGEDSAASTTAAPTSTTETTEPEPDRDGESGTYEVGQCYEGDGDGPGDAVDCDEEHVYEVIGIIDAPFDVIPDDADDQVKVACAAELDDYLGDGGIGEGIQATNLTLSGSAGDEVAGTDDELIVCVGKAPAGVLLTASVSGGADAALAPYEAVLRMEVGDCFTLYEDYFYLGTPVPCSEIGALVNLGTVAVPGDVYPGEEELKAVRNEECPALANALDLPNFSDASGTVPSESDWRVGVRVVTCDVEVPTR